MALIEASGRRLGAVAGALRLLAVLAALALFASQAVALDFPQLTGRVVDQAGILPPDARARLDQSLAALEQKSSDQLVVVTLPGLQGTDIADYGYQLGRHWGIGQAKLNNGALLIVAPSERKVRIEVGYGLEGTLTDALSSVIIQQAILPKFKAGDMPGGIAAGVAAIEDVLLNNESEWKLRAKEGERPSQGFDPGLIIFLFVVAVIILMILRGGGGGRGPYRRNSTLQRGAGPVFIPGGFGGGWGGGSGGGSSGGGFSGGGGSFGGGGSSGSW